MPNGFEARECHALSITQKIQLRSSVVDPVTPLLMLCVYNPGGGQKGTAKPVWPSAKALCSYAEGPRFDPLRLSFLFKKMWFMDTVS